MTEQKYIIGGGIAVAVAGYFMLTDAEPPEALQSAMGGSGGSGGPGGSGGSGGTSTPDTTAFGRTWDRFMPSPTDEEATITDKHDVDGDGSTDGLSFDHEDFSPHVDHGIVGTDDTESGLVVDRDTTTRVSGDEDDASEEARRTGGVVLH